MSDSTDELVTLMHPDGYDPIEVTPRRARLLVRQGWIEPPASGSTIEDVLGDVAGDPAKAQVALDLENASAKPRTTLIEQLQHLIDNPPEVLL